MCKNDLKYVYKSTKLICLLVVLLCFNCSSEKNITTKNTISFSLAISEDATPEVLHQITKTKENSISEIKFEKGVYHFYPDKGLEVFCYISNHDDVMVRTAFPIFNFSNLNIDGQGSTFIFHGGMVPFLIDDSKNISIKNVTIDWSMPFHSEGLVVANNEETKTFDLEVSDEYPYEIRNGQIIFVKEYYEHTLGQTILYDPIRKAIAYNTEAYTGIANGKRSAIQNNIDKISYKYKIDHRSKSQKGIGFEKTIRVEQLKPGLVRFHGHVKKKLPPIGTILTAKGDQSVNRLAPAFRVTHTDGFKATNVNVHHAGGMGLIAENSSDLILDGFNVTPSNGRMVSTSADATHFVGCKGKVELKNCVFNNQLDDATNVHGTYQEVVDVIDEYTLGVRMGHSQQQGFQIGYSGDKIGMVRLSESFFPYESLTIKNVEKINGRYQKIIFNQKLPKKVKAGDLIENLDGYPELLVENCTISNNRARGLLISNPKSTIIRNNFFSTEMEAILIPVESGHWFESGNAANLVITGNTFQDCQHSGFNRGVIRFVTDDDNENIAFKNIEITNNTFNHFDNLILEVANTDGLKVSGNKITNSGTFPMIYPENPAIKIKTSKNIVFENNMYFGKSDNILSTSNLNKDLKFE